MRWLSYYNIYILPDLLVQKHNSIILSSILVESVNRRDWRHPRDDLLAFTSSCSENRSAFIVISCVFFYAPLFGGPSGIRSCKVLGGFHCFPGWACNISNNGAFTAFPSVVDVNDMASCLQNDEAKTCRVYEPRGYRDR